MLVLPNHSEKKKSRLILSDKRQNREIINERLLPCLFISIYKTLKLSNGF